MASEAAAVYHYLAEISGARAAPRPEETADYFPLADLRRRPRSKAGRHQQSLRLGARRAEANGPRLRQKHFDKTIHALDGWFAELARLRLRAALHDGLDVTTSAARSTGACQFGTIHARDSLAAYAERGRAREAYQAGKAIDGALIAPRCRRSQQA